MRKTRLSLLAATGVIALVGLTGCAGGQSVEQACDIAKTEFTAFQTEMNSAFAGGISDPKSAETLFDKLEQKFTDVAGKVSNDEVKPKLENLAKGIKDMRDVFGELEGVDQSDTAAMKEFSDKALQISESMTTATTDLEKSCPGLTSN